MDGGDGGNGQTGDAVVDGLAQEDEAIELRRRQGLHTLQVGPGDEDALFGSAKDEGFDAGVVGDVVEMII